MAPFITLTDIKTYLGKTGTDDDVLIASIASNACMLAEQHTGRTFSVTSNVTRYYSTDGQSSLTLGDDVPMNDTTRVVTLNGATMVENSNVWFLPDRRNPDISITIQLRPYDRSRPDWYKQFPNWFDANLDNPRWSQISGMPNDLKIVGTVGHPAVLGDVRAGTLELAAWLYWRAKGGASSFAELLTGTDVDLALLPMAYQVMVQNWKVRTAVVAI